jgi:hypothetical protein
MPSLPLCVLLYRKSPRHGGLTCRQSAQRGQGFGENPEDQSGLYVRLTTRYYLLYVINVCTISSYMSDLYSVYPKFQLS